MPAVKVLRASCLVERGNPIESSVMHAPGSKHATTCLDIVQLRPMTPARWLFSRLIRLDAGYPWRGRCHRRYALRPMFGLTSESRLIVRLRQRQGMAVKLIDHAADVFGERTLR